jgi:CheY-like chemotaxis protein
MRYTVVSSSEFTYPDRFAYESSSTAADIFAARGSWATAQILFSDCTDPALPISVQGLPAGCEAELYTLVPVMVERNFGIKEEDIDRLFDAFKRVDEQRNRSIEGTGLGLNSTATMLKMMGSELRVQSTYGKGSEFSFLLKQKVIDHNAIGELDLKVNHQLQKSYTATFSAPDAKVLVVDDNEMNRKVLRQLLKSLKVDVSDAASGMECLEKVKQTRFDLIFMDPPYDKEYEKKMLKILSDISFVDSNTLIIIEASLDTDFGYLEEYGYEPLKEKKYKTNKHMFVRKVV